MIPGSLRAIGPPRTDERALIFRRRVTGESPPRDAPRHTEDMKGAPGRRPPRWSVRARILAAILLVAAVGLGLTGAVSYVVLRDGVLRDADAELLRHVEAAREVVDEEVFPDARSALAGILAIVLPPAHGSSLGIVDGEAALVPGSDVAFPIAGTPLVERVVRELADGSARRGTAVIDGAQIRYVAVPIEVPGAPDTGIFVVAIDLGREVATVDEGLGVFAAVGAGTLLMTGLVGWLVAGRLLRPVRLLSETAERITATDTRERIPVDGRDDVSRLTATINDMLDRLDLALRSQRELLDDVRHELRAPLTVIRGHLELVHADDPEDVRRVAELAIDELDRMADLVRGLAELAESRTALDDAAPHDLARLTRDVAERASALPGPVWSLGEVAEGEAVLDRRRIIQAWLQLADNAAKYVPAGTPVEIGSRRAGGVVRLWVRDHGPGVPEAQRERIFERFARVPGSGVRGSGLGLAIVAGIAHAHGGAVRLEDPGVGARFVIELPGEGMS